MGNVRLGFKTERTSAGVRPKMDLTRMTMTVIGKNVFPGSRDALAQLPSEWWSHWPGDA